MPPSPPVAARGRPWPPVAARGRPSPPVAIRRFHFVFILAGVGFKFQSMLRSLLFLFLIGFGFKCLSMLRSILFSFVWIWVQILIDASFDFVVISAGFGFRTCSSFASFWVQFGTILVRFWIHFGSIWGSF